MINFELAGNLTGRPLVKPKSTTMHSGLTVMLKSEEFAFPRSDVNPRHKSVEETGRMPGPDIIPRKWSLSTSFFDK